MGPVEHAIRATFVAPATLYTLGQRKPFELHAIDEDGIVLMLGKTRYRTRLSWACLESIPPFLKAQQGWIPAGGARSVAGEQGTLDEHLKRCTKTDVARWVCRVLVDAHVIEIAPGAPLRVRVLESATAPATRHRKVHLTLGPIPVAKTGNLQPYLFRVLQEQDAGAEIRIEIDVASDAGIAEDVLERILQGLDQLQIPARWDGEPGTPSG